MLTCLALSSVSHPRVRTYQVDVAEERMLLDVEKDPDTGEVLYDWRSPDYNGDRATLEYQGIDPDSRGPFTKGTGGLRPGGSMFS